MKREEIINWVKENEHRYPKVFKSDHWLIQILKDFADELQAKEISDEDLKQYITNLLYKAYDFAGDVTSLEFKEWVEEQTGLLEQYHNSKTKEVTDEEISEAAYKAFPYDNEGIPDSHSYSFCQGAEWYREQLKQP